MDYETKRNLYFLVLGMMFILMLIDLYDAFVEKVSSRSADKLLLGLELSKVQKTNEL